MSKREVLLNPQGRLFIFFFALAVNYFSNLFLNAHFLVISRKLSQMFIISISLTRIQIQMLNVKL